MTQAQRKRRQKRKSAQNTHQTRPDSGVESVQSQRRSSTPVPPLTKEERYAADVDMLFAQFSELF